MSDSRDNLSFLVQQFLVPRGSLIVGLGLMVWIADLFQASTPTLRAFGEALGAITALSAAFAGGYSIQRIWPWTYSAGRIVWILPVFFLLFGPLYPVAFTLLAWSRRIGAPRAFRRMRRPREWHSRNVATARVNWP